MSIFGKVTRIRNAAGLSAFLVMVLGGGNQLSAETVLSTLTYGAYFDFDSKSPKKDGHLTGSYFSLNKDQTHLLEGGLDRTRLDFGTAGKLDQTDFTLKYTRYYPGWDFKLGMHGTIADNNALASDGFVAILGADSFKASDYAYGADLFFSRYDNLVFSGSTIGQLVNVFQASPYYGKYFPTANDQGWYLQGKVDLAQIDSAGQNNFRAAGEGLVTWYSGAFSLTTKGFIGERQLYVDTGGFTTYNLGDIYKGGVKVEAKYAFTPNAALKAGYSWDKREINNIDSEANIYSLSLGFNF